MRLSLLQLSTESSTCGDIKISPITLFLSKQNVMASLFSHEYVVLEVFEVQATRQERERYHVIDLIFLFDPGSNYPRVTYTSMLSS